MVTKRRNSAGETETTWNFSKYHYGDWVDVYSTDIKVMKMYEKFSQNYPDHCKVITDDKYCMEFSIDPKCIGIKPKAPRKGPNLSEEQKRANAERLAQLRKKKQAQE